MASLNQNDSRPAGLGSWVCTGAVGIAGLLVLGGMLTGRGSGLTEPLASLFYFLLEALFYFVESSTTILLIAGLCLAAAITLHAVRRPLASAARPLRVAVEILWAVLFVLALIGQVYVIAFAALNQGWLFVLLLVVGFGAAALAKRFGLAKANPPAPEPPFAYLFLFLAIYLFVGMVAGHLATPWVHATASVMAALSVGSPTAYRTVMLLLTIGLWALWLPWLPGDLARRRLLFVPALAALVFAWLPTFLAVPAIAVATAVSLGMTWHAAGLPWPLPLRPAPRRFSSLLLIALLATVTLVAHYGMRVWRCHEPDHPAVRRLSPASGVFDLALGADGEFLLAALREPRRVLGVAVATGESRTLLDTADTGGARRLFSWIEPETLLPLEGGERFLLLLAVSDDEAENRIAVLDQSGRVTGYVDSVPHTGISDFVTDGRGRVYVSTEFEDRIFVLDEETLAAQERFQWPGAETNRILVAPEIDRMYSLGLWTDPYLRARDLSSQTEIGALRIGTRSWDMAYDAKTRRLFVPHLPTGRVWVVDALSLAVLDTWRVGFGARPIAIDESRRLVVVGNMYDGRLSVFRIDDGERVLETHLGGYMKSVHVDAARGKAYTGCACGIYEIDLNQL